jgi:hypothetical protein
LTLSEKLGFVPGAIAVMGKWEPHMGPEQCMLEVQARAAAAAALSEALRAEGGPDPFILSAEGHLHRQPKPGCVMVAEILIGLGIPAQQIRCWPAANHTVIELRALERMRSRLGVSGLLLVTSNYHVLRARHILGRAGSIAGARVVSCTSDPIDAALEVLPAARRRQLAEVIERGTRRGTDLLPALLTEGLAFLGGFVPGLEEWLADQLRGPVDPEGSEMFQPTT